MGNSRAQTEQSPGQGTRNSATGRCQRLILRAPKQNDHANNDDERVTAKNRARVTGKNREEETTTTSTSEQPKKKARPRNITDRTTRDPSTQDEKGQDSSVLLQAAPASGGGFAAASAGGRVCRPLQRDSTHRLCFSNSLGLARGLPHGFRHPNHITPVGVDLECETETLPHL